MHAEAEKLISKAKQVRNAVSDGTLTHKATRYMTHAEKAVKTEELARIKDNLAPSNIALGSLTQEGRANLQRYRQHLERDLRDNVAPEISAEVRDDTIKAERQLADSIREGMLPHEIMRRNPPGSVGHHIKWEREKKPDILAWKNLRRLNHPEDDSEDLANVELLRPQTAMGGQASTFMVDAQIPGTFSMSPQAKQNWPAGMPEYGEVNSPWKQALERENQELKDRLAALEAKSVKPKKQPKAERTNSKMTPEQRQAFGASMKAHRKAKQDEALREAGRKIGMTEDEIDGK